MGGEGPTHQRERNTRKAQAGVRVIHAEGPGPCLWLDNPGESRELAARDAGGKSERSRNMGTWIHMRTTW